MASQLEIVEEQVTAAATLMRTARERLARSEARLLSSEAALSRSETRLLETQYLARDHQDLAVRPVSTPRT